MRLLRGREADTVADRAATRRLRESVASDGTPAVRVWVPHRQVAFGPRDRTADGYERARTAAEERGYPATERSVGGRPVAYDGATTVAFARVEPVEDDRRGIDDRYERTARALAAALADLGVETDRGEPADAFCPGQHSLQREGKLVGLAQRITGGVAVVSGVCVVDRPAALAAVLAPVYDALSVPFDPQSVGSVAAAGGPSDPTVVARALEAALVGDADPAVERLAGGPTRR